jgi:outer membrane protein OmpA-like peptidoglycan-associated protein/tetratricopeptide (TPR) repeat protein
MKFIVSLLLFLISLNCIAQDEYTSSVSKAIRSFETALRYYDARQNEKALDAANDALSADPRFIEVQMLKANIYTDMKQNDKAIESYKAAIAINPDFFPNNYYSLGKVEYQSGKYADAKSHLEKFLSYKNIKPNLIANAKQIIANSVFAEQAVNNPVNFVPVNMGDSINSEYEEYFPAITADGITFLFTRRMPSVTGMGAKTEQEDFYTSTLGKSWSMAKPLSEINTKGNEGAPCLSADGQYLFFIGCEEIFDDEDSYKTKGSCDIFLSKKDGNKFKNPRNLNEPLNSPGWESQPSFSSDGRTLYFVRAIKNKSNITQYDIMVSRIGDNSAWSEPESVSDMINTPSDEMSVFIHPDDQTLYFASDGHPGMGGLDIYMSKKDSTGKWGKPLNLGYPINTIKDENSLLVSPNGEIGYFASDRAGGLGGLDLYQFPLHEKARPKPVTYMKGKVFDIETKQPLGAAFELIDLATGKVVVSSTSNVGNGEFLVSLPTGKSYALNVSKDGYLFYSENFELKSVASSKESYQKDIGMKPIKAGESIVLKNIFFEFDKYDLKDESKIELGKLITFLNKNPKVKFEVSGHTDNTGAKVYNQTLSEKRARSVYDFLLSKGIPAARMTSKGYGDTKAIADNNSESGRAQNRRTEFTVTGTQ